MSPQSRRSALALLGGAAASLAGCARGPRTPPAGGASPTPSATATPAGPTRYLVLTAVDPPSAVTEATVYPERLRAWLREAAATDATLRVRAETPVYAPEPVLPSLDRVRLSSPDAAVDGVYEVHAEGGTYYEWRVGAAEVTDVPEGADATPVADLPADRRELARRALRPDGTLVSPETELGTWVRHDFVGGYFSRDGVVYRGRKLRQTDAALFSRAVWYVLSLSALPADVATPATTLRLRSVPDAVRAVVDGTLDRSYHPERVTAALDGAAPAVREFLAGTGGLLLHSAAYEVGVDEAADP